MSKHIQEQIEAGKAAIVEGPEQERAQVWHQVEVDRSFELPISLHIATVACYLAFIAITFAAFSTPGLVIPMAIFTVFIFGMFGVPAIWTRLSPDNPSKPMDMGKFAREGIMTNTGRLAPRDAAIQVLILPVLIVLWGLAAVTIAALV